MSLRGHRERSEKTDHQYFKLGVPPQPESTEPPFSRQLSVLPVLTPLAVPFSAKTVSFSLRDPRLSARDKRWCRSNGVGDLGMVGAKEG